MPSLSKFMDDCTYCGFPCEIKKRNLNTCNSCTTALKSHAPSDICSAIKFLIEFYRIQLDLISDVKYELLSGGISVADQKLRVKQRVIGEKKVKALTMAYKYHKLIVELADKAPEEQLRLRITYKPKKKRIER